jgi:hypothetical protein
VLYDRDLMSARQSDTEVESTAAGRLKDEVEAMEVFTAAVIMKGVMQRRAGAAPRRRAAATHAAGIKAGTGLHTPTDARESPVAVLQRRTSEKLHSADSFIVFVF